MTACERVMCRSRVDGLPGEMRPRCLGQELDGVRRPVSATEQITHAGHNRGWRRDCGGPEEVMGRADELVPASTMGKDRQKVRSL